MPITPCNANINANESLPSWNLTDLYADQNSAEVKRDLEWLAKEIPDFHAAYNTKLASVLEGAQGGDALAKAIKRYEAISTVMGRLGAFAFLQYAADAANEAISQFRTDTSEKLTELSATLIFFGLELNTLDESLLKDKIASSDALRHYAPYLRDLRFSKPYQLSEDVERAFQEQSVTGVQAWNRLFDETMSSMTCKVEGHEEPLGLEATLHLFLDPSREVRKAASQGLSEALKQHQKNLTFIINIIAKDSEIDHRWRGYQDLASAMHLYNRVEPEVVDALTSAVSKAYPKLSHRYYGLKAKWLGLDKLAHWDRNAPLPQAPNQNFSWQEAKTIVLDAYKGFSPDMAAIAAKFFDNNWIDATNRPGKSPGAFSASAVPDVHPYILMNYQGSERDVMTLAHELGHGIHQVLSAPNGTLMNDAPLTLAETASVFGEMLTYQALLDRSENDVARYALMARKVEDMLSTVVRQINFYQFERALHEERRSGELSTGAINDLWLKTQAESLGPNVSLEPGYEVFWAYIPHFIHSPFYVYSYAFGDCLVNALYGIYKDKPSGFVDTYQGLLKAGGTQLHKEALAPFGLDASDPAFWQKGLGVIESMIDELASVDPALMQAG